MSEYYRKLDAVAQSRYLEKLKLLGLEEKDDPYEAINSCNFIDDMTKWPSVEYGHIFCYYIQRPGVYTRRQLMQWKSLEAFNYFESGHVRQIKVWPLSSSSCILMACVNPSQNTPENPHHAWVGAKMDGEIITLHCDCMAGLGEGCSHSAAILFKVEYAVRNGYTSVTSNVCGWNQVFTKKHQPARIIDITFQQPKRGNTCTTSASCAPSVKRRVVPLPTENEKSAFLDRLRELAPNATVLSAHYKGDTVVHAHRQCYPALPPTMMSLGRVQCREMDADKLLYKCEQVFNEMVVTGEESNFLFHSTKKQSNSLLWYQHRRGRLTASNFGAICRTSLESPSKSLVESILQQRIVPKTAAMQWGIDMESVAKQAYINSVKDKHELFEIDDAGLYVNTQAPHLGASTDGLISCSCCGLGVLEIKCPFSAKDTIPTSVAYIEAIDGGFKLSKKHDYYYQIQGQMAVLERSYCDFVCWTPLGLHIERIPYDSEMVDSMIPKLDAFFIKVILPKILAGDEIGKGDHEQFNSGSKFCVCQRGEFGKMIACDSTECEFMWFHYSCVNLPNDFEPGNDEWLCPECTRRSEHF